MNDVKVAESSLSERDKTAKAQASRITQERANLDSAQYNLSKVRIVSPIDGIVTARSIQEGEMVMIGTMNNAGTVLMTLADMSIIQAEIEVDETNVPQRADRPEGEDHHRRASPTSRSDGHVAEIGNSPIAAAAGATGTQATNFKVKVMLDEPVPEVRPGFTCTADITTATRKDVVAVPIPAVAVRELIYDANGQVVQAAARRSAAARHGHAGGRHVGVGAAARPDAQGNRRRVRRAQRHRRVHADQDGHRGRQVLRGAVRASSRATR